MAVLSSDDKALLRMLVKKELDVFRKEGRTLLFEDSDPTFPAFEEKYDSYLENLLKRLA